MFHSNERTVPSSLSFRDYRAWAEDTSTCPLGLGTEPKEGGGGESRAAESRGETLTPRGGSAGQWGAARPRRGTPTAPQPRPPSSPPCPALLTFLPAPTSPGPLPTCPHVDLACPGPLTADRVSPELTLLHRASPRPPPRGGLHVTPASMPRPSAQPAPRLPPARSTHKGDADAMTSLAQAHSVGDAAALLGLWAKGTCNLFSEREGKVGCVEGRGGPKKERRGEKAQKSVL